jgi:hypothetical protein
MSRHEESFQIPLPPEQAKFLCGHAIASLGLPYTDLGYGYSCAESFQFGFSWPVTMNVIIDHGDAAGMSRITIGGTNFGFGPIQSSHVRGKVISLRARIEQLVQQPPAN